MRACGSGGSGADPVGSLGGGGRDRDRAAAARPAPSAVDGFMDRNTRSRAKLGPWPSWTGFLGQALQLPEKERGVLASRLLRSLEPGDDEALAPDAWETACSEVLDRRMREVRDGTIQLVDGEAVFRGAAERIASRRP